RRVLELAFVDLLHVDLHLQAAEAERDLDVRGPAPFVVHLEALDTGHRRRHRRRVVHHLPDRRARRIERALALHVHRSATSTMSPSACAVAPMTCPSTICGWMRTPQSSTAA